MEVFNANLSFLLPYRSNLSNEYFILRMLKKFVKEEANRSNLH